MTINQLIERLENTRNSLKKFYRKDDFEIQIQIPYIPGAIDIDFVSMDISANNGKADIWLKEG